MRTKAIGFLFLMCACTTTIPLDINQGERILMLNAQWNTNDQEHLVYAGVSTQSSISPLETARIRCYMDDNSIAFVDQPVRIVSNQACFDLRANLQPGSLLKLELEQGAEKAYSEVVIPVKTGQIESVDTLRSAGRVLFKVGIRDLSTDRNYFRLRIIHTYEVSIFKKNSDGEMILISEEKRSEDLPLSHDLDPVLQDGKLNGSIDERFFDSSFSNYYSVFSDRLFSGGTCTLTVSLDATKLYSIQVGELYDRISVNHQAEIRLETISLATFDYLITLEKLETNKTQSSSLLEPVVLPSNVVGGTGFVSISTSDYFKMNL